MWLQRIFKIMLSQHMIIRMKNEILMIFRNHETFYWILHVSKKYDAIIFFNQEISSYFNTKNTEFK